MYYLRSCNCLKLSRKYVARMFPFQYSNQYNELTKDCYPVSATLTRHLINTKLKKHIDLELPSVQTRYMSMLLYLDDIPRSDNILAGLFTWALLAGYIVFLGTFTSIRNSKTMKAPGNSKVEGFVVKGVQNVSLLWVAALCCFIGASGMCWLWWR